MCSSGWIPIACFMALDADVLSAICCRGPSLIQAGFRSDRYFSRNHRTAQKLAPERRQKPRLKPIHPSRLLLSGRCRCSKPEIASATTAADAMGSSLRSPVCGPSRCHCPTQRWPAPWPLDLRRGLGWSDGADHPLRRGSAASAGARPTGRLRGRGHWPWFWLWDEKAGPWSTQCPSCCCC